MEKVLFIDPDRCTGCKVCEMVCSLFHENEINPIKSRVQVMSWEDEGIDIPMSCQHCESPPCESVCPTRAIKRDSTTGAVIIHEKKCIGCRICITACPFSAPTVRLETMEVIKCDLCSGDPQCAEFCEPRALQYIPATKGVLQSKRNVAKKFGEFMKASAEMSLT